MEVSPSLHAQPRFTPHGGGFGRNGDPRCRFGRMGTCLLLELPKQKARLRFCLLESRGLEQGPGNFRRLSSISKLDPSWLFLPLRAVSRIKSASKAPVWKHRVGRLVFSPPKNDCRTKSGRVFMVPKTQRESLPVSSSIDKINPN